MPYIEEDFPIEEINRICSREVYYRKPPYKRHKFWARRVSSNFRAIILATLSKGDPMDRFYNETDLKVDDETPIILDPFMGGGTTVLEALKLGCKVVGVDVNPLSCFVTKQEVTPVDTENVHAEFQRLEKTVGKKIKSYYKTTCPRGHKADIMYVFWSKNIICENCSKEVPLYKSFTLAKTKPPTIFCPYCGEIFTSDQEEATCPNSNCEEKFSPDKGYVLRTRYKCPHCGYKGKMVDAVQQMEGPPRLEMLAIEYYCPTCEAMGREKRGYKKPSKRDKERYEKIKEKYNDKKEELMGKLIPDQKIRKGYNTDQAMRARALWGVWLWSPQPL